MSGVVTSHPPAPARRWRGVGSPGVGGYVLAVTASALVLPLVLGLGALLAGDVTASGGEWVVGIIPTTAFYLLFVIVALIYGTPGAVLGCLVVHGLCLHVRFQAAHVAAAALVGAVTGWAYDAVLFDGSWDWLWPYLAIATGVGRAVVIPLARRRAS